MSHRQYISSWGTKSPSRADCTASNAKQSELSRNPSASDVNAAAVSKSIMQFVELARNDSSRQSAISQETSLFPIISRNISLADQQERPLSMARRITSLLHQNTLPSRKLQAYNVPPSFLSTPDFAIHSMLNQKAFARFDQDQDGEISKHDLIATMQSLRHEKKPRDGNIQLMMSLAADSDQEKVSVSDFIGIAIAPLPSYFRDRETKKSLSLKLKQASTDSLLSSFKPDT